MQPDSSLQSPSQDNPHFTDWLHTCQNPHICIPHYICHFLTLVSLDTHLENKTWLLLFQNPLNLMNCLLSTSVVSMPFKLKENNLFEHFVFLSGNKQHYFLKISQSLFNYSLFCFHVWPTSECSMSLCKYSSVNYLFM